MKIKRRSNRKRKSNKRSYKRSYKRRSYKRKSYKRKSYKRKSRKRTYKKKKYSLRGGLNMSKETVARTLGGTAFGAGLGYLAGDFVGDSIGDNDLSKYTTTAGAGDIVGDSINDLSKYTTTAGAGIGTLAGMVASHRADSNQRRRDDVMEMEVEREEEAVVPPAPAEGTVDVANPLAPAEGTVDVANPLAPAEGTVDVANPPASAGQDRDGGAVAVIAPPEGVPPEGVPPAAVDPIAPEAEIRLKPYSSDKQQRTIDTIMRSNRLPKLVKKTETEVLKGDDDVPSNINDVLDMIAHMNRMLLISGHEHQATLKGIAEQLNHRLIVLLNRFFNGNNGMLDDLCKNLESGERRGEAFIVELGSVVGIRSMRDLIKKVSEEDNILLIKHYLEQIGDHLKTDFSNKIANFGEIFRWIETRRAEVEAIMSNLSAILGIDVKRTFDQVVLDAETNLNFSFKGDTYTKLKKLEAVIKIIELLDDYLNSVVVVGDYEEDIPEDKIDELIYLAKQKYEIHSGAIYYCEAMSERFLDDRQLPSSRYRMVIYIARLELDNSRHEPGVKEELVECFGILGESLDLSDHEKTSNITLLESALGKAEVDYKSSDKDNTVQRVEGLLGKKFEVEDNNSKLELIDIFIQIANELKKRKTKTFEYHDGWIQVIIDELCRYGMVERDEIASMPPYEKVLYIVRKFSTEFSDCRDHFRLLEEKMELQEDEK